MTPRPLVLAAAVTLVAVIGAAMALVGALLLAVATGVVEILDPVDPVDPVGAVVGLLGIAGVVMGVAGTAAAVALWRGRAWGWAASTAIAVIGSLGAVVAIDSAGPQTPVLVGSALAAAALLLLLAPRTREAAGIG